MADRYVQEDLKDMQELLQLVPKQAKLETMDMFAWPQPTPLDLAGDAAWSWETPAANEWEESRTVQSTVATSIAKPAAKRANSEWSGDSITSLHERELRAEDQYEAPSAVEVARRKAQDIAMRSFGGKRKAEDVDDSPNKRPNADTNDDPERAQKRRYQRRLQKNRDTAFISRIRRRAYTSLLEESLTGSEIENKRLNASVDALMSEVVSLRAELRGLRGDGGALKLDLGEEPLFVPSTSPVSPGLVLRR